MASKPRIAYGSIGWLLRPMCKIVDEIKRLGLSGIEGFGLNELLPEDENLGAHLKAVGIAFVGAYYGASLVEPAKVETEMRDFERTVQQISRLSGGIVAVGGGRVFPGKERENWPRLVNSIGRMGQIAKRHNVRLAFHPHDGTMVFRSEEIHRLATETDPALVSFTFDTAHLAEGGSDICAELRKHYQRVSHIHLKDIRDKDFVELGRGTLPLEGFLRELHASGYGGWLTIELDATLDPANSAQVSVMHLRKLLAQIGWQ